MTTTTLTRDAIIELARAELAVAAPDVPADVAVDAHLRQDLGVDSLSLLEFVARLEFHYGLAVPDEDWPQLATLDAVADYVLAHAEAPA